MSGPVSTWMGDRLRAGIPSRYVTSQVGQLSLASLWGHLIEYQLGWCNGGNVTSAWWQVTLCDPMWHVSSGSGVATLRTAIHFLLTYFRISDTILDYSLYKTYYNERNVAEQLMGPMTINLSWESSTLEGG